MYIKQLIKSILPLTNRIHLNTALKIIASGFVLSGTATLLLCTLSIFLPVAFLLKKVLFIYGICMGSAVLGSMFLRPGRAKTFKIADSLGLKERLVTALELEGATSPLALAQRADALAKARSADFRSLYKINFPLMLIILAIALTLLSSLVSLIPSPAREKALKTEELNIKLAEQLENFKKEQQELNKKSRLSEEKLKEINKRIDEMLKELQKSSSPDDALKALSKTKNELDKLKDQKNSEDLQKLAEQFAESPETKNLSEALKGGTMEDIKQKLEELQRKTESMDGSQKEQLAKDLQKASEGVKSNKQLSESLSDLSEALASGNQSNANQALSNLDKNLSGLSASSQQSAQATSDALNNIMASIGEAKKEISDLDQSGSLTASDDTGQNPDGEASPGGQSNTQGNQQGNTGGQGQGGNQKGMGSNGVGEGSSNGDLGYSGDESGGGFKEAGEKKVKDYEKIYIPERLGGDADPSQITGRKGSSGQSHWTDSNAPVEKGTILPYDSVFGEYKNEAMRGLQDSPIPAGMKELVRDYFTSLE